MEILELISYLDEKIKVVESTWMPGDETGENLSYDFIDDNTIIIEWGWTSYEECDCNTATVIFNDDKINVEQSNSGNSCFGGDYESNSKMTFDNILELINYLNEEEI
jgi:hypothetical protein